MFNIKKSPQPISLSITNLSELQGAFPSSLTQTNQPKPFNDSEARRIVREELNKSRRLSKPDVISIGLNQGREYHKKSQKICKSPDYIRKDSIPCYGCNLSQQSPSLNQGKNFKNPCEGPNYIRKDTIPCWGCSLPSSTD
ncbi:hypothetical protein EB118_24150 [bacterium]|nr:hypothetical protein [bacterium]